MALTPEQIDEVLQYPALQPYTDEQKTMLREKLLKTGLVYPQVAVLFSDDASGGIIHSLVEDSQSSVAAARQLGKIMANINERINPAYGYPPTPIISNMIFRLGDYNEKIAEDVKDLIRQHIEIYKARVAEYIQPDDIGSFPEYITDHGDENQGSPELPVILERMDEVIRTLDLSGSGLSNLSAHELDINMNNGSRLSPGSVRFFNHGVTYLDRLVQQIAQQSTAEVKARLNGLTDKLIVTPEDVVARLERAQLLLNEHHDEQALLDYRLVLCSDPQNQTALEGVESLSPRSTPN